MVLFIPWRLSIIKPGMFGKNGSVLSAGIRNPSVTLSSSIDIDDNALVSRRHGAKRSATGSTRAPGLLIYVPSFIIGSYLLRFCCAIKVRSSYGLHSHRLFAG